MEIKIVGDLSSESAVELKHKLNHLAISEKVLAVDVSEATSVDIIGINTLATTYKISQKYDCNFSLIVKYKSEVYHLLKLTNFINLIPSHLIYD